MPWRPAGQNAKSALECCPAWKIFASIGQKHECALRPAVEPREVDQTQAGSGVGGRGRAPGGSCPRALIQDESTRPIILNRTIAWKNKITLSQRHRLGSEPGGRGGACRMSARLRSHARRDRLPKTPWGCCEPLAFFPKAGAMAERALHRGPGGRHISERSIPPTSFCESSAKRRGNSATEQEHKHSANGQR